MRILVRATAPAAASAAAGFLLDAIVRTPGAVVGLPTGRTAELLYAAVRRRVRSRRPSLARIRIFQLDEFVGVASTDPRSFAAFLRRHLLDPLALPPASARFLDGTARHPRREAARYDAALARAGGLDVAVLGIGLNGHIAFNEPADALVAAAHVARLTRATRAAQQHVFGSLAEVPTRALTLGAGTILRARRIVLLATGPAKAPIAARALQGPITTRVPASLLQLHPDATIVLDREAAARLGRPPRL